MKMPKIRFKGYTDVWEQRKFKNLFDFLQNNTLSRAELSDVEGAVLNVHYGDILVKFGELIDIQNDMLPHIVDDSIVNKYSSSFLKNGDVVIADAAEDETVGKCCEIAGLDDEKILAGLHTIPVRPKEKFACGYLGYCLNSYSYHNQLLPLMQGTKVSSISKSAIQETAVFYPKSIEEQKQIGRYFVNLDYLITLHQRKCEQVKMLKKYMLQKMFPQNGSNVPEIRFEGFTDAWEQRKFGEIYAKSSEKNDGSIGIDKNITVATMQYKPDVNVTTDEYLKTYYTFNLGDIAFEGHQSKEFRFGRFVENDIGNGIVSHIFAVFRPIAEYDLSYWKYAIHNERIMQIPLSRSTKASTMMHDLVTNDFLKENILVPSLEEQKCIGSYFRNLDTLITLHQRKCDKLQNLKKFMLQNMFA